MLIFPVTSVNQPVASFVVTNVTTPTRSFCRTTLLCRATNHCISRSRDCLSCFSLVESFWIANASANLSWKVFLTVSALGFSLR